jgi:ankyrin repeat protein
MYAGISEFIGSLTALLLTSAPTPHAPLFQDTLRGAPFASFRIGQAAAVSDKRLVDAAKRQDWAAVQALLQERVDVNVAQSDGATALHWAAHWDDLAAAQLLIRIGANVQAANDHGITPLALACMNGSARMVAFLLDAGADPNKARVTGETPLMTAARTGNVDVVKALLVRGADPHAKEPGADQTALMWAVSERHPEIVRVLLAAGADLQARSKSGFTPLLFAARVGDLDAARTLLSAGANVNDTAADGSSALLVATVRGHVNVATFLLEQGADANANGAGYTALHWAAGTWETELTGPNGIATERGDEWGALAGLQTGKLELVKQLLAHGADPNARLTKTPPKVGYSQLQVEHRLIGVNMYSEATPFLLAAVAADIDVMRALAAAGADPRLTSADKTTPLMVAAGLGRYLAESRVSESSALNAVRVALELGGDVNAINDSGNTALHGAAYTKANTIVQLLVDHGAALNVKNKRGQTPLVIADSIRAGSATVTSRTETGDLLRRLGAETAADPAPR